MLSEERKFEMVGVHDVKKGSKLKQGMISTPRVLLSSLVLPHAEHLAPEEPSVSTELNPHALQSAGCFSLVSARFGSGFNCTFLFKTKTFMI